MDEVRLRRERRDLYSAGILILIVVVFVGCHSLKCFLNIVELAIVLRGTVLYSRDTRLNN